MSNIIKWNYINFDQDCHKINSDQSQKAKEQFKDISADNIMAGLHIQSPQDIADSFLNSKQENEEGSVFQEGINVLNFDEMMEKERARIADEADALISDAKEQAECIVSYANEEAEEIRENAYTEGREQGYQEGAAQAQEELNVELAKLQQQADALSNEKLQLESDYQKQVESLEPFFTDLVASLVEKITGVLVLDRKDIILHLIQTGMEDAGQSQNFFIHVSSEEFGYVREHKEKLMGRLPSGAALEIVEDAELSKSQCIIETDTRMINSSLDVQLARLTEDLRLLVR